MKSEICFFSEFEYSITPSEIIEFLYCKRFTYFMKCLRLSQNEDKRYKVELGRNVHQKKEKENREYMRKKLNPISKKISVKVGSKIYGIKGIIDELYLLNDNKYAIIDYKFAEYDEKVYSTYYTQLILYALMVEETFDLPCNQGYIVYCRSNNRLVECDLTNKQGVISTLNEYKNVINGYYPEATKQKSKCLDCCYRNICDK